MLDQETYVKNINDFFGNFIMQMVKEKKSIKTFGDITFYLQIDKVKTDKDGRPEGWIKSTKLPYAEIQKFWETFNGAVTIGDKMDLWFSSKNPFKVPIEIFFSYPDKLVKHKICKDFHGAIPYAHQKIGRFPKDIYVAKQNLHYGRVTSVILTEMYGNDGIFGKYLNVLLLSKDKHLLINGKEYKNIIVAQKRITHTRKIGEKPDVHFLNKADYIFGRLTVWNTTGASLYGNATYIHGDISNICGEIHPELCGDVSNLSGFVTNLVGDVTGIKIHIRTPLTKKTHIQDLLNPDFMKEFTLLSNEDNQLLMKVWSCLSHHTIGVKDEERKLFDNPVKCTPPFSVDRWGRKYVRDKDKDFMWVFSINPADIMFAKDVNKCSTCFCLNSGNERWDLGMRCLIALNSVNTNLGVAFKIRKNSIKKMNQFDGIKFKWYEPLDATFFQYNTNDVYIWSPYKSWVNLPFNTVSYSGIKDVKPIYGHDGINCDHNRQRGLAYLETFIKDGYKWYRGSNKDFPLTNNYKDFSFDEISDEWKKQIELANQKADEIKKLAKGE